MGTGRYFFMGSRRGRQCAASSFCGAYGVASTNYRRGPEPVPRLGQPKIKLLFGASLLLRTWAIVVSFTFTWRGERL
jgi:hypothetical protein